MRLDICKVAELAKRLGLQSNIKHIIAVSAGIAKSLNLQYFALPHRRTYVTFGRSISDVSIYVTCGLGRAFHTDGEDIYEILYIRRGLVMMKKVRISTKLRLIIRTLSNNANKILDIYKVEKV